MTEDEKVVIRNKTIKAVVEAYKEAGVSDPAAEGRPLDVRRIEACQETYDQIAEAWADEMDEWECEVSVNDAVPRGQVIVEFKPAEVAP
jgi:hypothetical protein